MTDRPSDERRLAVDLFDETWSLLDTSDRTPEQDERMIHEAMAPGCAGRPPAPPRTSPSGTGDLATLPSDRDA